MNAAVALDGTTAQNDVAHVTPNGERSYGPPKENSASFSSPNDDDPSDSRRVVIDLTQEPGPEPPRNKKNIFPFLKLPSEIRNQIYVELIPIGYDVFYGVRDPYGVSDSPIAMARDKMGHLYRDYVEVPIEEPLRTGYSTRVKRIALLFPPVALNIFLVNKAICNEARGKSIFDIQYHIPLNNLHFQPIANPCSAVLYGQNTFNFNINAVPKKSDRSNVFGLFDDPARKHLLRDLRLITLHVDVNDGAPLAIKRHRERLEQFAEELQKNSHDSEHKSLLKKLKVDWFTTSLNPAPYGGRGSWMTMGMGIPNVAIRSTDEDQKNYIFGMEGLTALSGVDEVEITGAFLPPWLIECLTRCLKGSAEPPSPIDYPDIVVRRMNRNKWNGARRTYKYVEVSTKKWCDPWLNWSEFADREGIEVPEMDRLRLQGLV